MKPESPCKNCTKRKVNCHADCKEYLAYSQKADELRKQYGKARIWEAGFTDAKVRNILKWNKRLGKK